MTARSVSVLGIAVAGWLAVQPSVSGQVVRWAGKAECGLESILHAPDTRDIGLGRVTVSDFGPPMIYSGLAALLGVSESDLARADVIAFELNGGGPAGVGEGWESSTWTFSDGTNTHIVEFDENDPPSSYGPPGYPAIVHNGSIRGADGQPASGGDVYRKYFGLCCRADHVVSYILFDLHTHVSPPINVASAGFQVSIKSRPGVGEGTPDPDAVGVLAKSCPACPKG